ncbi:methyltransferase domain-containing protein [Arenibaculum sp.]|uniref:methyltransferase domain-containing protein n=1 Tax=Arenibaculum sp. TaxID=2865862 RepID=UPI002E0D544C|nr:methyltransferase domain-containing protein [Arenibaculum sp.]
MASVDLSRRSFEAELMDGPGIGFDEFERCLRELERINVWTFAYRPTLAWLDRLVRRRPPGYAPDRPLRILDAGCGGGDMLRRIAGWARRRGLAVELTGADLSPWSARAAGRATPPDLAIRYLTADVFDLPAAERWDVVVCALFAHHLDDGALVRFLSWMDGRAEQGWFVNDLHRHPAAHAFARAMVASFPVGRLVAHDAPLSVARAFTRADWMRLLAAAGLEGRARVEWFTPFRLCVGRVR